jgi:hypothetical protein
MRKIILLSFLYIIALYPFCNNVLAEESETLPLHVGISTGYIGGYNTSKNDYSFNAVYDSFQQLFNKKYWNGFYIGANAILDIYNGKSTSHTIQIHGYYEYFNKSLTYNEPANIIINGQITRANISQDYSLNLNYLTFETFYKFNFGNKHIGLFLGPSYSYLINNSYHISHETLKYDTLTLIRGEDLKGEFSGLIKNNFSIAMGLEIVIQLEDIEIVPNAIYYFQPRNIGIPNNWSMRNFRIGLDVILL